VGPESGGRIGESLVEYGDLVGCRTQSVLGGGFGSQSRGYCLLGLPDSCAGALQRFVYDGRHRHTVIEQPLRRGECFACRTERAQPCPDARPARLVLARSCHRLARSTSHVSTARSAFARRPVRIRSTSEERSVRVRSVSALRVRAASVSCR
jgi:hypothetical protein